MPPTAPVYFAMATGVAGTWFSQQEMVSMIVEPNTSDPDADAGAVAGLLTLAAGGRPAHRIFKKAKDMIVELNTEPAAQHKRTFFLVSNDDPSGHRIAEKFTCADIRELLAVERVYARLTGAPINIDKLTELFPEQVRGAHYWAVMKTQARADPTVVSGPFIVITEHAPSDEELLAWFAAQPETKAATAATPPGPAEALPEVKTKPFRAPKLARAKK